MDNKEMVKQAIDFHKQSFENCFSMMVTIQGQAENMFNSYLNQANWMPPDLKKTMEDFTATYKKSCEEYKK